MVLNYPVLCSYAELCADRFTGMNTEVTAFPEVCLMGLAGFGWTTCIVTAMNRLFKSVNIAVGEWRTVHTMKTLELAVPGYKRLLLLINAFNHITL